MASKKPAVPLEFLPAEPQGGPAVNPKVCVLCGGECVRGEISSVANFGVTREPHFVTSYGWMQVRYDRATPVESYMCLSCGYVQLFGQNPLAVLDPLERQQRLRTENPELDKKLTLEEKRRKELEKKGLPLDSDEHTGL